MFLAMFQRTAETRRERRLARREAAARASIVAEPADDQAADAVSRDPSARVGLWDDLDR